MYIELLDAFEKIASELSAEELETLSAELLGELEKEANVLATGLKTLNTGVKNIAKTMQTGVKSSQQAITNTTNTAASVANNTAKVTAKETRRIRNKPKGSFIKRHPYVSTLAGTGVGVGIGSGISNTVDSAHQASLAAIPQQTYYR